MKKTALLLLLCCVAFHFSTHAQSTSKSTLEIKFKGIRNDRGQITIGISNSSRGWPHEPVMNREWKKTSVVDGVFTARVENLEYGTYAVAVLDDENSNLEMEMTLGIPREGWGFSMNPPLKLSAPKFEECSFRVDRPFHQITIDLHYAGKRR
jgi:uncharacterized protein (DUF2141 family)